MFIAMVVVFVAMMLWGFVSGSSSFGSKMNIFLGVLIFIAVALTVIWATGLGSIFERIFNFLFSSGWSGKFWTNFIIIALVIGAIVAVVKFKGGGDSP